ncbi:MAG: hypothetical protein K2N32_05745 [Clostridia bacterium]|nr:hypothetical protein [Clostridia bacterium]
MDLLYEKLTGIDNATFENVREKASSKIFSDTIKKNAKGLLTLEINGIEWLAVALSENDQSEPILTLWQANGSPYAAFNDYGAPDTDGKYPANMYATSKIRAVELNAGSTYYNSLSGAGETIVNKNSNHKYAIYTMTKEEGVSGSLTNYIDKPSNVSWLAKQQSSVDLGHSNDFHNDAYAKITPKGMPDYQVAFPGSDVTDEERFNLYISMERRLYMVAVPYGVRLVSANHWYIQNDGARARRF